MIVGFGSGGRGFVDSLDVHSISHYSSKSLQI